VGNTLGIFGFRLNLVAANVDTGVKYSQGSRYVASGTFDLKPTDKLTISADLEYFRKRIVEPAVFLIPNGATVIPNVDLLDPKQNIGGMDWDTNDTEEFNYLAKAVYQFSKDWDVSAYYGVSHLDRYRYNPQFAPGSSTGAVSGATDPLYASALNPTSAIYGQGQVLTGSTVQAAAFDNTGYSVEVHGKVKLGDFSNSFLIGASRSLQANGSSSPNPRLSRAQNFNNPVLLANTNAIRAVPPTPSTIDDKGIYFFDQLSYKDVVTLMVACAPPITRTMVRSTRRPRRRIR
jgi:iron complex outermembrane receptor protein